MYYLRFVVCKDLRASAHWPAIAHMINLPALIQSVPQGLSITKRHEPSA